MPAQMRSASVGGAVAGGVLLAEPEGPWHFTWPDVVAKTASDLVNGYFRSRANPDAEPDDDEEEYPGFMPPMATVPTPGGSRATPLRTGGNGTWLLIALVAGIFLLPKLLR